VGKCRSFRENPEIRASKKRIRIPENILLLLKSYLP
jgi:hypothetical protein